MNFSRILPFFAVICVCIFGCSPSDEVVDEKPAVAFTGKTDPRLLGKWKAEGSGSIYEFKEDGSYKLTGKVSTQGGTFDNNVTGSWLVNDEKLLIKDQAGNVVPYAIEVKGTQLHLSLTGSLKNKTVLQKQ